MKVFFFIFILLDDLFCEGKSMTKGPTDKRIVIGKGRKCDQYMDGKTQIVKKHDILVNMHIVVF